MLPYTYDLPRERIAQRPIEPRDAAGMLVVTRQGRSVATSIFSEFPHFVRRGDLLVVNNTTVRAARLFGEMEEGGGECELLLLRRLRDEEGTAAAKRSEEQSGVGWWCIGRPMKRFLPGVRLTVRGGLRAVIQERLGGEVRVRFESERANRGVRELLGELGTMPIPPYIRAGRGDERDREDYQTIFARSGEAADTESSIAAPTASLHFTEALMERTREAGCEIASVTLHVGLPSVRPLFRGEEGEVLNGAGPGVERYRYDPTLVQKLREVRERGGRVIAVGTTVVRALESMVRADPSPRAPVLCETDLFISPGFSFRAIDAMVTNFHQPGSSHLLLVESFLGRALLTQAYEEALAKEMRFLSYGDGMFLR